MADYKSIIKGTVRYLGKKAKNITENSAVREVYDRSSTTAKCYANIAKLTVLINGELEEQKNIFTEIGHIYYKENAGKGEGPYEGLFEQLEEIDRKIEEMRVELNAAKASVEAARKAEINENGIEVEIVDFEDTVVDD